MKEHLKHKLATLPMEPGCYIMKDKTNKIIYVGKAKKLKNRVNQYFVGAHDFKTTKMVSLVEDFDYIITTSEKEALLLEYNLIKKHKPRYNIMFIDDKSYPYICLTNEKYPLLKVVRTIKKNKKDHYFGPYPSAQAAHETVKILKDLYPVRRCEKLPKKVCLYYHLNQCLGPCEFSIDDAVYEEMNQKIITFLNGDVSETLKLLKEKMLATSERMDYEQAKVYADNIKSIQHVILKTNIEVSDNVNRDIFAYYVDKGYICIHGFLMRQGKVIEREFKLIPLYGDSEEEFTSFLMQYYQTHTLPKQLVLPSEIDVTDLKEIYDLKVYQPIKGKLKKMLEMCLLNAKNKLETKFEIANRQETAVENANEQLNKLMNKEIHRIEVFDNSHLSGKFTVGAMVVYTDGKPSKKDYRHYQLSGQNDDLKNMSEMVYRRYFRLLNEEKEMPDLILVDGGYAQIQVAYQVLKDLGLSILLYGLSKDDKHQTSSLVNVDGEPVLIDKKSDLFFFLTRMQDEVHRFALSYHQKLRTKAMTQSILDNIKGVGPSRKQQLLKRFKSVKQMKEANLKEISEVVGNHVGELVFNALHQEE